MNTKLLLLLVIAPGFLLISEHSVRAQSYNLEVGIERYFESVGGLGGMPVPLGIGAVSIKREIVIGEKEIDGITWSVVVWEETANEDHPQEHIRRDTTLLREHEGKLYEYKDNEEVKLIFDYRFSVGDSISEHFEPYMPARCQQLELNPEECIYNYYMVNPPRRIQIDTTVTFPDKTERRVLWGPPSDFTDNITAGFFADSILTEDPGSNNMLLPLKAVKNWENASFYFVDGWGVMRTPVNHRNIYMTGIIKPDGKKYGYHFHRYFEGPGVVRMSEPEAGMAGVVPDIDGNIVFRWKNVVNAENYDFQIALNDYFYEDDIVIDIREIEDTTISVVADNLEPNTQYWWRVRANNEQYGGPWFSVYEARRYFTTGIWLSTYHKAELPESFTLHQNYPNPFNPSTVIEFGLPVDSKVRLEIFNVLGQSVALIVNEQFTAGWHSASLDASAANLSSGVYIYKLQAGDFLETRTMSIVK